ncbi:isoquinoline 1-oxidoreductase beta subunit [Rhizobium sp. BK313]|uniref:xanthine dehydrogenase family protein molybdopterin-binding subunit n=1 Tax=Rhizobium sp. BK313 TaxID=2587081 RepID=UPI001060DED6|nr:molybdopterin cofactor-binding domain-containing protein [Rhizobium sp. BK313]MBB3451769.1 isoquinoline 1-oxidoreductase beta subunit [Rhizobium sp. BK313]
MSDQVFTPTRRSLLKGALVLSFALPLATGRLRAAALAEAAAVGAGDNAAFHPYGLIRIDRSGITLVIPNVEMGQGIYTAEAMLMAEELEVDLDQIQLEAAPANPKLYATALLHSQGTGGSTSIRSWWEPLRKAGAGARTMLISAAANQWQVDPASCKAERGAVLHPASSRTIAYTAIAADAANLPVPADVPLKDPSTFRIVGKPMKRLDTPAKVNGTAKFGLDIRVPGMKVANVIACPVFGGTLKAVDSTAALAVPGAIKVLTIDNAVAVVGDNTWAAQKAARLLNITWDEGANVAHSSSDIHAQLAQSLEQGSPIVALDEGGARDAIEKDNKRIDAIYDLPFLAHATMEPINTIVHVRADGCDIWCGTQVPATATAIAAKITGLPPESVNVHNQLLGGGFGRRLEADSIAQAVALAKQVDFPLQVVWTREEDIRHDYYRPAYHDRISASLGPDGVPTALWHRVTGGSVLAHYAPGALPKNGLDRDAVEGSTETPYKIEKHLVEYVRQDPPEHFPISWWRGVGPNHNVFVIESFIDELAHAAKDDPVDYRRKMLADNPRALAMLNLAAEKSGWGQPLPARSGRGISLHQAFGSFCALVLEVEVSPQGDIRMNKAIAAIDCGYTVNPDTVVAQIEGGTIFGLSAALYSGIEFDRGRTVQSNFHDYRILRIDEAPKLEVYRAENTEKPGGIGEVGTVSAAPALGNAIFAATGVRLRRLPYDRMQLMSQGADKHVVGNLAPIGGAGLALLAQTALSRSEAGSERREGEGL